MAPGVRPSLVHHMADYNAAALIRTAVFSSDRRYRYVLGRRFVERPDAPLRLCVWCNPSQADEKKDDASIRVGLGFAWRWGDGGILVINVGDIVETDSTKLPEDPNARLGPLHWEYVVAALSGQYGMLRMGVMCGWGDIGDGPIAEQTVAMLRRRDFRPMALGVTKNGNPGHPLRKSSDLELEPLETPLEKRTAFKELMRGTR